DELDGQLVSLATREQKMVKIYNFIRHNMSWNGIHSKYSVDGIKDAWKKRTGTSGDINLLLVNRLRDAGLEAYPLLVSERSNGKVNTDYPFINQFNSVMACVIVDGKKYYLDATDQYTPARIIPYRILNTTAFLVNRNSGELINITDDAMQFSEYITNILEVRSDGTVKGEISIQNQDYARVEKSEIISKDDEFNKKLSQATEGFQMNITGSRIDNRDNDSLSLEQDIDYTAQLNETGGYKILPLNFIPEFQKNPFTSDHRFSNINFGYKRNFSLMVSAQLPRDMVPDALPNAVSMTTADNSVMFKRKLRYDSTNNTLDCNIDISFKISLVDAESYDTLKEMYKKIFAYLKEPVLLKKK
ncbi:MAG TPA: hypothetical protein VKH37_07580, partial [Ferruginibacter sp.]|nr:hypothetical protein [Ferruginibacter sp.]